MNELIVLITGVVDFVAEKPYDFVGKDGAKVNFRKIKVTQRTHETGTNVIELNVNPDLRFTVGEEITFEAQVRLYNNKLNVRFISLRS